MKRLNLALCGLAIGIAAGSPSAIAQPVDRDVVVIGPYSEDANGVMRYRTTVNYADLDLNTTSGRAALEDRVEMTARSVCNELRFHADGPVMNNDCYRSALDGAMAQVRDAEDGL